MQIVRSMLSLLLLLVAVTAAAQTTATGVDRLYILDCGNSRAPDQSRWSPGVNVGKSIELSDNCYLLRHASGYFVWDTGYPDSIGDKPVTTPVGTASRNRTLASQLAEIGVKPSDVRFVGISHTHGDHVGNVDLFPAATVLIQKAEYEWAFAADKKPPFDAVLSGDAAHFKDNWDNKRVPSMNVDGAQTLASMKRIADLMAARKAELWINHDKPQSDTQRHSPQFYD